MKNTAQKTTKLYSGVQVRERMMWQDGTRARARRAHTPARTGCCSRPADCAPLSQNTGSPYDPARSDACMGGSWSSCNDSKPF